MVLEARGISGDPCISEEGLRRRQQEKDRKKRWKGQKHGLNEELLETADANLEMEK